MHISMFLGEVTEPSVAMVIIVSHQGRKRNAPGKTKFPVLIWIKSTEGLMD